MKKNIDLTPEELKEFLDAIPEDENDRRSALAFMQGLIMANDSRKTDSSDAGGQDRTDDLSE